MNTPAEPRASKTRSRLTLVAIFVVFLSPVLASWLYFHYAENPAQKNNGELFHPARALLSDLQYETLASHYDERDLQGFWSLLYVTEKQCFAECLERLDHLNRVRLSTGKKMRRVRLLFLSSSQNSKGNSDVVLSVYPGKIGLMDEKNTMLAEKQLTLSSNDTSTIYDWIYIVDPNGNVVLRYNLDGDPLLIRRDLARLLRASQIG